MPPIVAALGLLALLIAVAAAFYWQERHPTDDGIAVYGVEDSIEWVWAGLSPDAKARMQRADVRRILEWDVRYLQDPSVRTDPESPAVAGGIDAAAYAHAQSYATGHSYEAEDILEVLRLRTDYLAAIGVIGGPVAGDTADGAVAKEGEIA